jgi:hypothetical protein
VNGNVWPKYSLYQNNTINASFIELHADNSRLGKVWTNRYTGNDGDYQKNYYNGYAPAVINNCFNFWDPILSGQF